MTNVVVLRGHISRAPEERELPSGDRLTTIDVTVPAGSGHRLEPSRCRWRGWGHPAGSAGWSRAVRW
jgi:hypothetical protein